MRRAPLWLALGCGACGGDDAPPRGQWLITLSTDAPVPQLGDRVLVEVIDDAGELACTDDIACRRTFAADVAAWPLSFGIARPSSSEGLRIRARLYRSSYVGAQGLPSGSSLIERVATLAPGDGVSRVWMHLPAQCFGVAWDPASHSSCGPDASALAPEQNLPETPAQLPSPNEWPAAARVSCPAAAPAGMTCVPGGVFLLGESTGVELLPGIGPAPERLIGLRPFWLDDDEVSVGQVRALAAELSSLPTARSADAGSVEAACTFPAELDDTTRDLLPVSCVTREQASEICAALGKRLPTEAEWEYAASNLELESSYPWGEDPDACERAVVGRGRTDVVLDDLGSVGLEDSGCRLSSAGEILPWGPVAGGDSDDTTALGIRNLGGNIREFVQDLFAPYSAPCWQSPEVPIWDPVCTEMPPLEIEGPNARGGAWGFIPLFARSWMRVPGQYAPMLGVRCARSAD